MLVQQEDVHLNFADSIKSDVTRKIYEYNLRLFPELWNPLEFALSISSGSRSSLMMSDPYYNEHRAPKSQKGYLEINDKLNRVTESFKPELEFYQRKYPSSSILEIKEFFWVSTSFFRIAKRS